MKLKPMFAWYDLWIGFYWDKKKNKHFVIKYDYSYKRDKLIREISWLLNLDKSVSYLFPKIVYYSLNKKCPFYIMPHYGEYTTLSDLFLHTKTSNKNIDRILNELLNLMFNKIYPEKVSKECGNHIQEFYIKRIEKRHKETLFYCKPFKKLINERKISINDVTYENAPKIVARLKNNKKAIRRLSPLTLSRVHGDLHFGNILFSDSQKPRFKLVDPAAFPRAAYTYDMGKLYHSFHGMYDALHDNKFRLDLWQDKITHAKLEIERNKNYDHINRQFKKIVEKNNFRQITEDPEWATKALFAEACHFISMMPFYLENEEKAKAIYLQGVVLLNNIINKL